MKNLIRTFTVLALFSFGFAHDPCLECDSFVVKSGQKTIVRNGNGYIYIESENAVTPGRIAQLVAIGPDGRKWFGHTSAISVLNDGGTPFDKADDHWLRFSSISSGVPEGFVNAIIFDDNQCAWVGSDHGLSRMCGQSWLSYEAFGYVWDLAAVHTETNTLIATSNHMTLFSVRGETNPVFLPVAVRVP